MAEGDSPSWFCSRRDSCHGAGYDPELEEGPGVISYLNVDPWRAYLGAADSNIRHSSGLNDTRQYTHR